MTPPPKHRASAPKAAWAAALLALAPAAACRGQVQDPPAPQASALDRSYLATNAKAPGVVTTPSGLQYRIVHSGPPSGAHPGPGDEVKVDYEGALVTGAVFDSTFKRGEPAILPLGGLVPGWEEALPMMRPGDEWMLYVPSALGYGDQGAGGVIPGGAVLVFRLKLLGVLPRGGGPATG